MDGLGDEAITASPLAPTSPPFDFAPALAVADAVCYEGYLLYPYRRSSAKNQARWQFGVLMPGAWLQARGPLDRTSVAGSVESTFQQAECLLEAPASSTVTVRLRFLQLETRSLERRRGGRYEAVDELVSGGARHLAFAEGVRRERDVVAPVAELLASPVEEVVELPAETSVEELGEGGRLVRRRLALSARLTVSARPAAAPFPLTVVQVRVENTVVGVDPAASRDEVLRQSLLATHALVGVDAGSFLPLLDPPEWAAAAARGCRNVHTFPVLAGPVGRDDIVVCSPIILYDHVRLAPESPLELHDGGEIDELLLLRARTMTDEEKAEARATDPRSAAIVDGADGLPPEVLERLHGAIRSLHPVRPEAPAADRIVVGGVALEAGGRVRLRPRGRADAQDMFLDGRTGSIEAVLHGVDGSCFAAVRLEGDAGQLAGYGRPYHLRPEELELP